MSNSPEQKKQYELPSDLIEDFLSEHEFIGKEINYIDGVTLLQNQNTERYVKVPTNKILNHAQIEECLFEAGLTSEDLTAYIEHLKIMGQFDTIIAQALNRKSNKNKYGA